MSVLYSAMDSRGVNVQPERYASPAAALFFVAFIVLVCFCCIQLLIGVFVETYTRFNGNALLTRKQRYWVELQRRLGTFPLPTPDPDISQDPLRMLAHRVAMHPALSIGVYVAIGVSWFVLALRHQDEPLLLQVIGCTYTSPVLLARDDIFLALQAPVITIILICEVGVKLFAFGPYIYFHSAWHWIAFLGV